MARVDVKIVLLGQQSVGESHTDGLSELSELCIQSLTGSGLRYFISILALAGKSCLLDRYVNGFFEGQPRNTIGAAFAAKKVCPTACKHSSLFAGARAEPNCSAAHRTALDSSMHFASHVRSQVLFYAFNDRSQYRVAAPCLLASGTQLALNDSRASAACTIVAVKLPLSALLQAVNRASSKHSTG